MSRFCTKQPKIYAKDFYWSGANAYIFNYKSKKSISILINCEYGYDGLEDSEDIFFIDFNEFPDFILNNIDKHEGDVISTNTKE